MPNPQKKKMKITHKLQAMILQRLFLQMLILVVTATAEVAKPGCRGSCGNLIIPYPFGTSEGCYHDEDFLITCNETSGKPVPFLRESDLEVTNISMEGQLYVLQEIAQDCYDSSGAQINNTQPWIWLKAFWVSDTENKFTAVGCDTYAYISGNSSDENYENYGGCISACSSMDHVRNGSCGGIGCCQTAIPKGAQYFDVFLTSSSYNHTLVWKFNPCSYAFVVQEDAFNFSSGYLVNGIPDQRLPLVLDWAIGNVSFDVKKNNSTCYACQGNSTCIGADNGSGYRCICSNGYEGNPYIGCYDIDECKDSKLNGCDMKCVNKEGSYACYCPKGYHGDGWKNKSPCIADPLPLVKIFLCTAISVIVLLVCVSWLYFGLKKRKLIMLKEKFFRQNGGFMLQQQLSRGEESSETTKIFSAEELKMATNNYDENRIIGRGGYGTVYKGILTDNRTIAIKKSKVVDQSQIEQFINEVVVLSQINHRNVVKLLGCCLETQVPLLVYEFVTNGTLFDHIHNTSLASNLSWEIRLRIATETAGVLSYLHSSASTPIIHRDIKPTNILLDNNYTAKVSDFGASRLVPVDQDELSTIVQGTLGYLDPEYLHTNQLTEKSDVYSFGVVLVELLTGKKALCFNRREEDRNLAMYFLSSLKEDCLFRILDVCVLHEGNTNQIIEIAKLAKRCLMVRGEERPTMKEVAMELEGLGATQNHPWVNVDLCSEETTYLLAETPNHQGVTSSNNIIVEGDSIRNQTVFALDGGR